MSEPRIRAWRALQGLTWIRQGLQLFARQPMLIFFLVAFGPIFLLVVEADIDFIEPARLGRAELEFAPPRQPPARRAAVRPAGKAAVYVGRRLRRERRRGRSG